MLSLVVMRIFVRSMMLALALCSALPMASAVEEKAPEKASEPTQVDQVKAYAAESVREAADNLIQVEKNIDASTREFGRSLQAAHAQILRMTAPERLKFTDQLIVMIDETQQIVQDQPNSLMVASTVMTIVTMATIVAMVQKRSPGRVLLAATSVAATMMIVQSIRDKESVLKRIPKIRSDLVKLRAAIQRDVVVSNS